MNLAAVGGVQMHRHRRRTFPPSLRDESLTHRVDHRGVVYPRSNFRKIQDAHKIFFTVSALTLRPEITTTAGPVHCNFPLIHAAIVTAAVGSIRY